MDDLLVIDADSRKIDELQALPKKEFKEITVKYGPKISRKIDELQALLKKEFKEMTVKYGPKISFLGMSIEKARSGDYIISQQSQADEISREYATTDYRTPKSPANANTTSEAFDPSRYRSEVMKFLYLHSNETRPSIRYRSPSFKNK